MSHPKIMAFLGLACQRMGLNWRRKKIARIMASPNPGWYLPFIGIRGINFRDRDTTALVYFPRLDETVVSHW